VIVRKVPRKAKILVYISDAEKALVEKLGIPLMEYVKAYVEQVAKERKWSWYKGKIE